jgi:AsmA protein
MSFELALDRIDLDRYRAPVVAAPAKVPPAKAPAKPTELPSETLKGLQLKGIATIGSLIVSGMNLTQVHVGIESEGGVTRIAPAKARLYGGEYSGEVALDERGSVPTLKLDQTMGGVDIAQLLKDFAKTQRFSGHGTVTTNLTAHGKDSDAMTRSLSGRVTANLADGAIEGLDLWFEVNRAMALVQKQVPPAGGGSGRTKFDAFKASADVTNGVATTKDLNVASQNLHITGQGSSNLVSEAISYQVKATLFKSAPAANAASAGVLAEVPLDISGTMSAPRVRPDLEGMARARVQQELEKHKGELQQKLQDKLKQFLK